MLETKTADAANDYEIVCGNIPPPRHKMPPAAVSPEISFVTDIKGVCKAGLTLQTDL